MGKAVPGEGAGEGRVCVQRGPRPWGGGGSPGRGALQEACPAQGAGEQGGQGPWVQGEEGACWVGGGPRTWQRLMMSASVASRSTTLPLPSSPHCAPSTTVTREPVAAASCCSRPRLTPPGPGGRSLEARVPDMLVWSLLCCAGPRDSPAAAATKRSRPRAGGGPGAGPAGAVAPLGDLRRRVPPPPAQPPLGSRAGPRAPSSGGGGTGTAGEPRQPGFSLGNPNGGTRAAPLQAQHLRVLETWGALFRVGEGAMSSHSTWRVCILGGLGRGPALRRTSVQGPCACSGGQGERGQCAPSPSAPTHTLRGSVSSTGQGVAGPTCLPGAALRFHQEAQPLVCRTLESRGTGRLMAGHLASREAAGDAHQPRTTRVSKRPHSRFLSWPASGGTGLPEGICNSLRGSRLAHPGPPTSHADSGVDMASPTGRRGQGWTPGGRRALWAPPSRARSPCPLSGGGSVSVQRDLEPSN